MDIKELKEDILAVNVKCRDTINDLVMFYITNNLCSSIDYFA